jgi:hypothetical protein
MSKRLNILNRVASGELTPVDAEKQLLTLTDDLPRSAEFWSGFDYACSWLDELFAKSHPHTHNIADCLKAKVNRLPKSKIRPNLK